MSKKFSEDINLDGIGKYLVILMCQSIDGFIRIESVRVEMYFVDHKLSAAQKSALNFNREFSEELEAIEFGALIETVVSDETSGQYEPVEDETNPGCDDMDDEAFLRHEVDLVNKEKVTLSHDSERSGLIKESGQIEVEEIG